VKEQEIYKNMLRRLIDQTEKLQINNTEELVQKIIRELNDHELPKTQRRFELEKVAAK
jgi:hypothetical protein